MFRAADATRDPSCRRLRARVVRLCLALMAGVAVGACAGSGAQVTKNLPDEIGLGSSGAARPAAFAAVSAPQNAMASDFLDLAFQMENGRALPVLSRFEGPIRVRVTGQAPATANADLARLITRLQVEAGIDIALAARGASAEITVEFQPRAVLQRLAPTAACFVVPGASSLAEFRRNRGAAATDWGAVTTRTRAAIFVPSDTSPQEVRDCLHEELAQAIGPLNDLYRLPDSVFNDDNFHTVLTDFDMAILRAYMAPELRSGMTQDAVSRALPSVLSRTGTVASGPRGSPTTRAWVDAIQGAVANSAGLPMRRADGARALAIAQKQGWDDARTAFSHFAVARLEVTRDPATAVTHFALAEALWARRPGTAIHVAHIELQRASMALAGGDAPRALGHADRALPAIRQAENAALEATALLIKAEALAQLGRGDEARRLRLDSRDLARYGFGTGSDVEARVREIADQRLRISSN